MREATFKHIKNQTATKRAWYQTTGNPTDNTAGAIVKPVVAVTLIRNQLAGVLPPSSAVNPEIQLSFYALKELDLTKPNGLIRQTEIAMETFLKQPMMPEFSNGFLLRTIDSQYISRIKLYCAYYIYRFYLGSSR